MRRIQGARGRVSPTMAMYRIGERRRWARRGGAGAKQARRRKEGCASLAPTIGVLGRGPSSLNRACRAGMAGLAGHAGPFSPFQLCEVYGYQDEDLRRPAKEEHGACAGGRPFGKGKRASRDALLQGRSETLRRAPQTRTHAQILPQADMRDGFKGALHIASVCFLLSARAGRPAFASPLCSAARLAPGSGGRGKRASWIRVGTAGPADTRAARRPVQCASPAVLAEAARRGERERV
jgi:hypothetical protein